MSDKPQTTPKTEPKTEPKKLAYQRELMRKIRARKAEFVLTEIELAKKLGEKCDQEMCKLYYGDNFEKLAKEMGAI